MLADITDVSGAVDFEKDGSYAIDAIIIYKGVYYISSEADNTGEPTVNSGWDEVEKFTTACYNELWCLYGLGDYLSRKLLISSMAESAINITGNGIVVKRGEGFMPAQREDRGELLTAHKIKANKSLERMIDYIILNKETDCFEGLITTIDCESTGYSGTVNTGKWVMY